MIGAGVPVGEIILATFILNFRHFLMSTALSRKLKVKRTAGAALSYGVTDETFVVASVHGNAEELGALGFFVMALMAYLAWFSGSLGGALFSGLIPVRVVSSMGIGLYALFIALLIPSARKNWQHALVAGISAGTAWLLSAGLTGLSEGWVLILATLGISALGTLLPEPEVREKR